MTCLRTLETGPQLLDRAREPTPRHMSRHLPRHIAGHRLESMLSAAALVGVLMAASVTGIADDDWDDRGVLEEPLADETYSDPWGTEYDDPFAEQESEAGEDAPDRFRLYDSRGQRTGRVERDPLGRGSYTLYDQRGGRTGRVREDPVLDDSYSVYDERGRRVRDIRKSPFLDGRYDVYDTSGRRIGRIEESPIIEGQYDIYDEKGRRTGRVEGD